MAKPKTNYHIISVYRKELLGIAILMILIFHFFESANSINNPFFIRQLIIYWYAAFGSIGVDIFAFLSGMGVYHSLYYNKSIHIYFKNRVNKIIIPYFIIGIIYWTIKDLL